MITMKEEHKNTQYRRPDETISLDELKSFLWGAATRLRGQIDAAGYKEYIFPLLFFKRISDVYDEQFEGFVAEGGEDYAGMQATLRPVLPPFCAGGPCGSGRMHFAMPAGMC